LGFQCLDPTAFRRAISREMKRHREFGICHRSFDQWSRSTTCGNEGAIIHGGPPRPSGLSAQPRVHVEMVNNWLRRLDYM
jgi:hypothetical protein